MKIENIEITVPKLEICAKGNIIDEYPCRISELHYHDELEFLPIYTGSLLCKANGKDYTAKAGDLLFINAGIRHETFITEKNTRWGLLQFKESDYLNTEIRRIIKYSVKFQNLDNEPIHILRSRELFQTVDAALMECSEKKNAYEIMTRSHILKILGYLYREEILSDGEQIFSTSAVQKILPAMTYINQNYAQDINLDEISDILGFDRSYFCRVFKTATGATFTEYLNFVRVCKAEKRLSSSTDSILSIATGVGFSSVSYFNKIFKKHKDCSPSAYRTTRYCKDM